MHETISESVIMDITPGTNARLRPVAVGAVHLTGPFWAERRRINREVTLPSQYALLERTGRIDNFRRAAGKRPDLEYRGAIFNDSDVYKWVEAVGWSLTTDPNAELEALADQVIDVIAAAQQADGYLNTYFMFERAPERWTNFDAHEMYCAGHMIQAAIAYQRGTGKTALLDVAIRLADYLDSVFGPEEQGKRLYADGHEEIEMALVELYRTTGERRYLDLAHFFIDVRGYGRLKHPRVHYNSAYYQDDKPFTELETMTGHAVRAVYYACGAADVCLEQHEPAMLDTLDRLWQNMTTRRMYVSGGLGSRYEGEAFGIDYELTNERAYTETCAAIGSVMWNQRMLAFSGDARYADLLEHTLYNAVLPGIALDGETYFYQNPLADDGHHRRQEWFGTACCPPNVARLQAALPGYFYSTSSEGIWAHLYAENWAVVTLASGQQVRLEQHTDYPWDGDVRIDVLDTAEFSLYLRVPEWCQGAQVWVNGELWAGEASAGRYAALRRHWQAGDVVRLHLPMQVQQVRSHPYVAENSGRVALVRGPLLYCVEAADFPGQDVRDLVLELASTLAAEARPDLLGGVTVLQGEALLCPPAGPWRSQLYSTQASEPVAGERVPFLAIPYYAWANREPGRMQVWLRTA